MRDPKQSTTRVPQWTFTPQISQQSTNTNHALAAAQHELESNADGEPGNIQEAFNKANRNIKENEKRQIAKSHLTFTASPKL